MRKKRKKEFDFTPMGKNIRLLREEKGLTKEEVAEKLSLDPRYYSKIEDEGQYPSLGVLYDLAMMFDISVDEYFWPDKKTSKSTRRRNVDNKLDTIHENELEIVDGVLKGIIKSRTNQSIL